MKYFSAILFIILGFISCTEAIEPSNKEENVVVNEKNANIKTDSILKASNFETYSDSIGNIGVFEVPEMLVFSLLESCSFKDAPFVISKAYSILQNEIKECGAEIGGAAGCISYNNDTNNYVFECIIPIKQIAKKNPKKSKMVALTAGNMAIYNYYGSYQYLYRGYANLRSYIKKNNYKAIGPMREFYITDAMKEKNPEKWLTRLMIPVSKINKPTNI